MAAGAIRIKPGFATKRYSWIDVGDLCGAILHSSARDWETHHPFYLGSEGIITDAELIATAAEVINSRGITISAPQIAIRLASLLIDAVPSWREAAPSLGRDRVREILPQRWVSDGGAFAGNFAWSPSKKLTETLRETAEWLKAQGKI